MSSISFRDLTAEDIEVRVAQCNEKGVTLLLYKDARCDMRILDEAVGAEHWTCEYEEIGGNLFCRVGIQTETGGWVDKEDVGTPSNMEGEKGCASDAFKRACFKWGIGRELYTAPFIWVATGDCSITKNAKGKPVCYDRFSVESIDIKDGRIKSVKIRNDKTGKTVYPKSPKKTKAQPKAKDSFNRDGFISRINDLYLQAIELGISADGIDSYIKAQYGVDHNSLENLAKEELTEIGGYLNKLIADKKTLLKEASNESD